ncbi:hypothetical protein BGX38DRAFT_1223196 [Terfezia claveryi]|nr:hypothetical protein BGX38DRAFT_1223196 [Terfezia claveryi]
MDLYFMDLFIVILWCGFIVYLVYFLFFYYESGLVYLYIINSMGLCCESGVLFV